ncbi:hypothetical protein DL765_011317 [Monosporascus sp. GIB2]|nr:hypothetical protein DL765_011317 [Monosporascus sp. GIB2]
MAKFTIVTGGGSSICHALTKLLLAAGCSVMTADLRLRPEAGDTVNAYPHPPAEPCRPSAVFHRMMMPLYYASKAAVVNFVKCLGSLRRTLGIRNSCTPLFDHDHCRRMLRKEGVALTPGQCAAVIMRVPRKPQYGDGNIVETRLDGFDVQPSVREVPLEALYPTGGPLQQIENAMAAEDKMKQELQLHGIRGSAS